MNIAKIALPVILLLAILLALRLFGVFDVPSQVSPPENAPTALVSYSDSMSRYSIGYPQGWAVHTTSENVTGVTINGPASSLIDITVYENNSFSLAFFIELWEKQVNGMKNGALLDSGKVAGFWDYHMAWRNTEEDWSDTKTYSEIYFKKTEHRLYQLLTTAPEARYDSFPFKEVAASFKLLTSDEKQ
jgi:hypothetical protein